MVIAIFTREDGPDALAENHFLILPQLFDLLGQQQRASLLADEFEIVLFEGSNPLRYTWYMLGVGLKRVQSMPGVRTIRAQRIDVTLRK